MDASFDRRPAGERAITRPTPATSTPAATRATNHRRRRTRRRERFEPCRKRASARSSANPMIGKLYGLVHSVLTLCKRPLPAHGARPDDESGVPISVWTATERPERARPGRGRWAPERSPLDSDRRASASPSVVRLTARTSHVIRESDETNLRPSAVDRLDRRGAADPPGRRGRHRRSGSIAVDAARGPEDAPCPAGPCPPAPRADPGRPGGAPGQPLAVHRPSRSTMMTMRSTVDTRPAVYEATLRPDAVHTS